MLYRVIFVYTQYSSQTRHIPLLQGIRRGVTWVKTVKYISRVMGRQECDRELKTESGMVNSLYYIVLARGGGLWCGGFWDLDTWSLCVVEVRAGV